MLTQPQTVMPDPQHEPGGPYPASTADAVRELPLSEAQLQQMVGGVKGSEDGGMIWYLHGGNSDRSSAVVL